jgi:putative ATPase
VNSALLSRSRVYTLNPLTEEQIVALLERALADEERGLGALKLTARPEALARIAAYSSGDARSAYNVLEIAATLAMEATGGYAATEAAPAAGAQAAAADGAGGGVIEPAQVEDALQRRVLRYDKAGEEHYNLISALHKSVRNSDPDATLYWLLRMLESGEDPMYLARRIVRMAVEDISLADPHALEICIAARDALDFVGLPEGGLALAHAAVYLAIAPKSNALYRAYAAVKRDVEETAADPVPLHLRNAPTRLMKELGYGAGYKYAHDFEDKVTDMECLPENLKGRQWYFPTEEGVEKRIRERLAAVKAKKEKMRE